jgi:hypothetical protein
VSAARKKKAKKKKPEQYVTGVILDSVTYAFEITPTAAALIRFQDPTSLTAGRLRAYSVRLFLDEPSLYLVEVTLVEHVGLPTAYRLKEIKRAINDCLREIANSHLPEEDA